MGGIVYIAVKQTAAGYDMCALITMKEVEAIAPMRATGVQANFLSGTAVT